MASTTFLKDTRMSSIGTLRLLLLGILLPSVLVSGQTVNSTSSISSNFSTAAINTTTQSSIMTSSATAITNSQLSTAPTSGSTAASTSAQVSNSVTPGTTNSATIQSSSMTAGSTSSTTGSITNSITNPTTTAGSTTQPTAPSGSATMTTTQSTSGGGISGMNGTTTSSSSMSMLYCPSFGCNYSDCYTLYTTRNATSCGAGAYCQLIRQMDMWYTVGCSASCADSCVNASHTGCSMICCNYTDCINGSFASMMMTTSTVTTSTTRTTTTPATTTTTMSPQTTPDNGKKCHQGTCTGATCYTNFGTAPLQTCSSSQPHCQLKKETVDSNLQWTAGCTTNCSGETACKASTQPPCHLECCNATMTSSCLWLNGTMNVPSFATRGPHLNTEVIASLLCLLAISLLL
nr:cell wall integrity and stress response component 4 isoform X2 [Scatophagus argus]